MYHIEIYKESDFKIMYPLLYGSLKKDVPAGFYFAQALALDSASDLEILFVDEHDEDYILSFEASLIDGIKYEPDEIERD